MRKVKEILRLRFDSNLSMAKIALASGVSSSTVQDMLVRHGQTGLGWPLPDELDDTALEKLFDRHGQEPRTKF